jgi:hypothetical protein
LKESKRRLRRRIHARASARRPPRQQIKLLVNLFEAAGLRVPNNLALYPAPGSIEAFAHHLSEVLRIARTADFIATDLSDALHEAANDFIPNNLLNDTDTPEFIKFALERSALREKGGR